MARERALAEEVLERTAAARAEARSAGGIERMWTEWNRTAEDYLVRRSGSALQGAAERYRGRGLLQQPRLQRRSAAQCSGVPGAANGAQRQLARLTARVEELDRQLRRLRRGEGGGPVPGALPHELGRLWARIRATGPQVLAGRGWDGAWATEQPPPLEACARLLERLRDQARRLAQRARANRLAAWRARLQDAWRDDRRKVFQWCRDESRATASMLRRPDGTYTGDVGEMDGLLRRAWDPIMRMYADSPEPGWGPFAERFGKYIKRHPMPELRDLTGADLRATLARMPSRQAGGMEGWRVRELKALPEPLLDALAEVLNEVERQGAWPAALERALVTLIPKGEGGEADRMRPISVMSAVYRVWAATRMRDVRVWQEQWAAAGQHGYRPLHGTEDVYWALQLRLENALLRGEPLYGLSLDWSKCFDRLPQGIMLRLVEELGMSPRVLGPLRAMYARLTRRFRAGGGVGSAFTATNGILQGCPLSVALLNAAMAVWAAAIAAEVPGALPEAFADDQYVTAGSPGPVRDALAVTVEFGDRTGGKLNAKKSATFGTAPVALRVGGAPLGHRKELRCVGAPLTGRVGRHAGVLEERMRGAVARARRLAHVPLPIEARAALCAAFVLAFAMFGCAVHQVAAAVETGLRRAATRAIWGRSHRKRCPELVLTLAARGHLVDPLQYTVLARIMTLRRMIERRPDLRATLRSAWEASRDWTGAYVAGPAGCLRQSLSRIGWGWPEPGRLRPGGGAPDIELETVQPGRLAHEARDAARRAEWRAAAARRDDIKGIEEGIDREATWAGHRRSRATPYELGIRRTTLCGGTWTHDRLYRCGVVDSDACPYCGMGVKEDQRHRWWTCPAWEPVRRRHPVATQAHADDWPACLACCGIMPEKLGPPANEPAAVAPAGDGGGSDG
eukprot:gene57404-biopygen32076